MTYCQSADGKQKRGNIPGVEITVIKLAPMGDPMEVQIHGYELTLRLEEDRLI